MIITIFKSTNAINIQIHHFKTTFMCPLAGSITGVPFDSVGHF